MKIEDKVHIELSKDELLDIIKIHFMNSRDIELNDIEIVIDDTYASRDYPITDVTCVKCKGHRIEVK